MGKPMPDKFSDYFARCRMASDRDVEKPVEFDAPLRLVFAWAPSRRPAAVLSACCLNLVHVRSSLLLGRRLIRTCQARFPLRHHAHPQHDSPEAQRILRQGLPLYLLQDLATNAKQSQSPQTRPKSAEEAIG